jgi:hypothetical protein
VDTHRTKPVADLQAEPSHLKRKFATAYDERDSLKKGESTHRIFSKYPVPATSVRCKSSQAKYAFIQVRIADVGNLYRLSVFCRMLEVPRSVYYDWVDRSTQPDPCTVALEVAARVERACLGLRRWFESARATL